LSFSGYVRAKQLLEGYWKRVAERGVDESPYRAGFAQIVCVGEDDAEAERLYAPHLLYFFNRCLHVYPGFADAPGYRTLRTLQAGALPQFTPKGLKTLQELCWKDLVEAGFVIAGSPATVRDRMLDMIRSLRVGNVFCLLHMGDMPDEVTRHSTRLFAERVMPQLRGVFPEWQDDDRFWIHPLESRRDPSPLCAGAR
jgi:alkanesulfonate monooxygenase SsuD/methylene tetrahydromethanopterin reductase-like flavin-dependent oxidoreductase (luciferase family)